MLNENEGEAFWLLGMLQTIRIGKNETAGQYGSSRSSYPKASALPGVHPEEDEWFYVLEGEIAFWLADSQLSLKAGSFRSAPRASLTRSMPKAVEQGASRLRADAVRGIPEGGRRASSRARPASAN